MNIILNTWSMETRPANKSEDVIYASTITFGPLLSKVYGTT